MDISKLPLEAKRLYVKAYDKAPDNKNITAERAVSHFYSPRSNSWVLKSQVKLNTSLNKSGFFMSPSFYFNAILSTNDIDNQGHQATEHLLKSISKDNLIDESGDVDHLTIKGINTKYDGIFKKVSHKYEQGKLWIKFAVNSMHTHYKDFVKEYKNKEFINLSAEYKNARVRNNKIIYSTGLGWTLVQDTIAVNSNAKIISSNKK